MSTEHDIERIDATLVRHEQRMEKGDEMLLQIALQLKENAGIQKNLLDRLEDTTIGLPAAHRKIQKLENIRLRVAGAITLAVFLATMLNWVVEHSAAKTIGVDQLKQVIVELKSELQK